MIEIRSEEPGDLDAVRRVNQDAFGRPDEARIVDALRGRGRLAVSLVAVADDQIVGHIAFSPVEVVAEGDRSWEALALGPMAVGEAWQGRGIGSDLVRAGLEACRRAGHPVVFVLGHPTFYPRFGFAPARRCGIGCEYEVPEEVFMVAELDNGALGGRRGTVRYDAAFLGE